jgi:hypothetical protein
LGCDPRLAQPACPGQEQTPRVRIREHPAEFRELVVAANERPVLLDVLAGK